MTWLLDNKELLLEVIGAASALALIFAKLTKNKTDDKIVGWIQWGIDKVALNPVRKAEKLGEKAVKANPAKGPMGFLGEAEEVE